MRNSERCEQKEERKKKRKVGKEKKFGALRIEGKKKEGERKQGGKGRG